MVGAVRSTESLALPDGASSVTAPAKRCRSGCRRHRYIVTVLPLDSGSNMAGMALKALPGLSLGVAAGVATILVSGGLLTFWGRKVWPWLRTVTPRPSSRLGGPEIEDLARLQNPRGPSALLSVAGYHQRCWIRGDVKKARGVLELSGAGGSLKQTPVANTLTP